MEVENSDSPHAFAPQDYIFHSEMGHQVSQNSLEVIHFIHS